MINSQNKQKLRSFGTYSALVMDKMVFFLYCYREIELMANTFSSEWVKLHALFWVLIFLY